MQTSRQTDCNSHSSIASPRSPQKHSRLCSPLVKHVQILSGGSLTLRPFSNVPPLARVLNTIVSERTRVLSPHVILTDWVHIFRAECGCWCCVCIVSTRAYGCLIGLVLRRLSGSSLSYTQARFIFVRSSDKYLVFLSWLFLSQFTIATSGGRRGCAQGERN